MNEQSIQARANAWIASRDTGVSSKTIWSVMTDTRTEGASWPRDGADFGRCHRLLTLIPEWRDRLPEVADRYPAWKPLVDRWDEITAVYLEELPSGCLSKTYDLMHSLRDEMMRLEGWSKTGRNSFSKPNGSFYVELCK